MIKTKFYTQLSAVALGLFLFTGCQTVDSVSNFSKSVKDKVTNVKMPFSDADENDGEAGEETAIPQAVAIEDGCPIVIIPEDAHTASQYMNPDSPSQATVISSVTLTDGQSKCTANDTNLIVDVAFNFEGALSSFAQSWNTRPITAAYPYYVTISDANGNSILQEKFTTSLSLSKSRPIVKNTETMRQMIPLQGEMATKKYFIKVGMKEHKTTAPSITVKGDNSSAPQSPPVAEPYDVSAPQGSVPGPNVKANPAARVEPPAVMPEKEPETMKAEDRVNAPAPLPTIAPLPTETQVQKVAPKPEKPKGDERGIVVIQSAPEPEQAAPALIRYDDPSTIVLEEPVENTLPEDTMAEEEVIAPNANE